MKNWWNRYRGTVMSAVGGILCGVLVIALITAVQTRGTGVRSLAPQPETEGTVSAQAESETALMQEQPEPLGNGKPEPYQASVTRDPLRYLAFHKDLYAGLFLNGERFAGMETEEEELEVPEVVVAKMDDKEDQKKSEKDSGKGHADVLTIEDVKKSQEPEPAPAPSQPDEPAPQPEPSEKKLSYGIDVSKWNRDINWTQVAQSGVEFVMIRCGYRGNSTGGIVMDPYFRQNISGALNAGLPVGIYFYSQAISVAEARQEAQWVISVLKDYHISFPVVFDYEGLGENRIKDVTKSERSDFAIAYLNEIKKAGYTPMMYASKNGLTNNWETSRIVSSTGCRVWMAHYTEGGKPSNYTGHYDMWQYTSMGRVPGINGDVDMNIAYWPAGNSSASASRVDRVTASAVDEAGKPLAGVTITLDGTLDYTAVTGEDGVAHFSEIRLDSYDVTATGAPEGYVLMESSHRSAVLGKPIASFDCGSVTVKLVGQDALPAGMDRVGEYLIYRGTGSLTTKDLNVNIRSLPDVSGVSLFIIPGGTTLKVTGLCRETGWYRVIYQGKTGFITYKDQYIASVTFTKESGSSTDPTQPSTEPPTEPSTQPSTEPSTSPATEPSSEEPATQPSSEEPATEPSSEEPATQPSSDATQPAGSEAPSEGGSEGTPEAPSEGQTDLGNTP